MHVKNDEVFIFNIIFTHIIKVGNIVIKYISYVFIKFNKRCLLQIKRNLDILNFFARVSRIVTSFSSALQHNR